MRSAFLPLRSLPSLAILPAVASLALTSAAACAQSSTTAFQPSGNALYASTGYSSSTPGEDAKTADSAYGGVAIARPIKPIATQAFQPFSGVGIAVKVGTTGVGFDISTPLARHLALRTGASFFSYNTTLTEDGMNITGSLKFQSAAASLDIYPFHNSFRISPGLSYANHNRLNATLLVPGGQTFSFGDGGTYYSDPQDPVHGTASFLLGKTVAPRITMGWGNIMPHAGARVSFPFELGFQYVSQPTVGLAVTGSSCGSQVQVDGTVDTGCGPVDQTNVAQEQAQLQSDLNPLRFYPVASLGVSVRIGHGRRSE